MYELSSIKQYHDLPLSMIAGYTAILSEVDNIPSSIQSIAMK